MKIVYLNPGGTLGGAERSLLDFFASLRQFDPALDLHLLAGAGGPFLDEARILGASAETLAMPPSLLELGDSTLSLGGGTRLGKACGLAWRGFRGWLDARKYARQLRARLQELAPHVVHSNGIKCHILADMARLSTTPLVWHIHDFLSTRRIISRVLRWSSGRVRHAIAVSRAVEADIRGLLPGVPTTTIYNGIDTEYFAPGGQDGARLDRLASLPPGGREMIRVGMLATYARWKGQDVFLAAAAQLPGEIAAHRVRFFIVGGPIYQTQGSQYTEAELRELAARLGVADRVGFIPFQTDTAAIYRDLDIVVHASTKPEPFGLTIVQAMACGRAVIAMQAGGAAELFTHEVDALGAPPNDPAALAAAILRLAREPNSRLCLGANARKSALARFSRQRLGGELLAVYRNILAPAIAVSR